MKQAWALAVVATLLLTIAVHPCQAQNTAPDPSDTRTQYPPLMRNGYFGLGLGLVDTPFTARQLQPGYSSSQVQTPGFGASVVLVGHQFGEYVAVETGYSRPFKWASFNNLNGTGQGRSVWMAIGEFKVRLRFPLSNRFALYGDAGAAITSRHGAATDDGKVIVENANYWGPLVGAGAEYSVNPRWSVLAGFTRTAGSDADTQPRSLVVSGGVRYHLRPLDPDRLREASRGGYVFPKHLIQIGYADGGVGFGTNDFLSTTVPIFWGANLSVDHGFTVRYEQNMFHTRKRFAFDMGVSVARWHAQKSAEHLVAASVYPIVKLILLRSEAADFQVHYSLAGPAVLSSDTLDTIPTGTSRFIFQDLVGIAISAGKSRNVLIGLGIGHYSNGNLSPINPGINIPLTMTLGYAF